MLPRPLVTGLAVLISIAWAANLVVGLLDPGRSDPAINAIFAIVVGAVFALGRRSDAQRNLRRRIAKLIEPEQGGPESDDPDRGGQS